MFATLLLRMPLLHLLWMIVLWRHLLLTRRRHSRCVLLIRRISRRRLLLRLRRLRLVLHLLWRIRALKTMRVTVASLEVGVGIAWVVVIGAGFGLVKHGV